jgi:molybdopterin-guanine dinucleotide biosynthesis protein A
VKAESESLVLGVMLAGGQNRRYDGAPKALESVGEERIADRAIRAMREAFDRVVLVANDEEVFETLGLEIRPDLTPGLGALGGIQTAVAWAGEEGYRGAVVVACDMPFLSPELLARLAENAGDDEVIAPASESRRGLEPLCAFYGIRCREAIDDALARGDRHVISFFPDVRVRTIPLDVVAEFGDPDLLFLNVNTPRDRELAEAVARGEGPTS